MYKLRPISLQNNSSLESAGKYLRISVNKSALGDSAIHFIFCLFRTYPNIQWIPHPFHTSKERHSEFTHVTQEREIETKHSLIAGFAGHQCSCFCLMAFKWFKQWICCHSQSSLIWDSPPHPSAMMNRLLVVYKSMSQARVLILHFPSPSV